MSNQPPFAEYPRPDQGGLAFSGRGPGVYFEAIGEAWNLVMQDIGHWIAATLVLGIISVALRLPGIMIQGSAAGSGGQVSPIALGFDLVLSLVAVGVQTILTTGMISMGVRKSRGEYINVGMMFEPFTRFGSVFGAGLLYSVVIIAAFLACILPGFYFSPVLVLMPVVAFLKGVGPVGSLSLCYDRCKSHWSGLLGLTIVLGLILFAGTLVCGVGLLIAWPIYCVVLGIHYRAFFESGPFAEPAYR